MRHASADVLCVIAECLRDRGYPPTVREIGDRLGLRSPSSVHHHLLALRDLGYLAVEERKPRAMRITDKGMAIVKRRAA